ncbi:uncharacterized protein FA14DRAFT_160912, partial [Meira miltonrushii]
MTQLQDSDLRARSQLDDWFDDGDVESEDDGPGAHNSTTIRPLSPTPIRVEIPARFQPLLLAIYQATPPTFSDAKWDHVKEKLRENGRFALLNCIDEEAYLKEAKRENMPVEYNTYRTGEIKTVWTQLPYQWLQRNPTADDQRNANGRSAKPQKRSEYKQSLKILHGSTNLTTDIVKVILRLSRHHKHRIRILDVADMLGGTHMVIVVRHVVRLLRTRGLLIDWDDRENVWIMDGMGVDKNENLRETFEKFLKGKKCLQRAKELIEKDFWDEDPNVFLLFHTADFARLVDHARKSTDCVKMTASNEVIWI